MVGASSSFYLLPRRVAMEDSWSTLFTLFSPVVIVLTIARVHPSPSVCLFVTPPSPPLPPICLSLCVPLLFFLLFQLQTIPPRLQHRLFLRKHLETVNHLWINNQRRHVSQLHSVECNKRASQVIDPALFGNVAL